MRPVPPPRLFDREVRAVHLVGVGGTGMAPLALYLRQAGFDGERRGRRARARGARWLETGGRDDHRRGRRARGLRPGRAFVRHSRRPPGAGARRRRAACRWCAGARCWPSCCGAGNSSRSWGRTARRRPPACSSPRCAAPVFPAAGCSAACSTTNRCRPAGSARSDWVVAEIDESDGTIDGFSPEITVMVSLDWDHPDHYERVEQLEEAFRRLVARTRRAVVFDPALRALGAGGGRGAQVPAVHLRRERALPRDASSANRQATLSLRLDGGFPAGDAPSGRAARSMPTTRRRRWRRRI